MHIPYPQGSIVLLDGKKQIIDSLSCGAGMGEPDSVEGIKYSVMGHEKLGSKGLGSAWHSYDELTLISMPTPESWQMLVDLGEEEEEEYSE